MPLDIAFNRPDPFLRIPTEERASRSQSDNDYCVIDGCMYFIRGYLPVPIRETNDVFGWGFWCKVSKDDYMRYCRASVPGAPQPEPFPGYLANTATGYTGVEGLKVEVRPVSPDKRPKLTLEACDHILYREQQHGITMQRVHQINASMFPDKY